MKEYRNDDKFHSHIQYEESKNHNSQRFIKVFLVLLFCLTVLTIWMIVYSAPFFTDKQPNALFPSNELINTGFNIETNTAAVSNTDETSWCLILINKWNYIPDDIDVELIELASGESIDRRIYPALQKMFDAAIGDGVYPVVISGYRTAEEQQSLMDQKIAEYRSAGYSSEEAEEEAEKRVAVPGTSEHQLGIAVDINADRLHSSSNEVYEWLAENAYKFGFIYRYLPDKTEITGIVNEPWHYRYVGLEAAAEIYHQGICLEEYLNEIN